MKFNLGVQNNIPMKHNIFSDNFHDLLCVCTLLIKGRQCNKKNTMFEALFGVKDNPVAIIQ